MVRRPHRAAVIVLAFLFTASPLHARPAHKRALADYFGPYLARRLNDCRTCHVPDGPGDNTPALPSEKPHNAFGARVKAVKQELRKAGKPTSIAARLEAIADEDSDGDGVSNLLELLSGHFPGEANDRPTAAELAEARKTLVAFRQWKQGYRWAPFEKVERPPLPAVKNTGWVRNPIDRFIAAEHEAHGLRPRPEASKATLLRRVYLDLIGLPPTPAELHAFVADDSTNAFEKVVDKLLASPQYGERWGRHWMDIWRYSDWAGWTDGGQIRDSQPHIWRWRDWIVESLNRDKGYDRMIVEMLAADELAPEDTDALRATGYLARNYKMLSREKWMQDTVDHTFLAFQAVTIGCARCHDHMYDPILQKEYYQVRAIFEPHNVRIDRLPGQPDTNLDGLARVYDANPQVPTFLFIRGDDRTPDKTPLPPAVPEALGGKPLNPTAVKLPVCAYEPDRQEYVIREQLAASQEKLAKAKLHWQQTLSWLHRFVMNPLVLHPCYVFEDLFDRWLHLRFLALAQSELQLAEMEQEVLQVLLHLEDLEDAGQKNTKDWIQVATQATALQRQVAVLRARRNLLEVQPKIFVPSDKRSKQAESARIREAQNALARAEADLKLPPSTAYKARLAAVYPTTSTGRRLAFARWLANRDNPLTARVAMNHIWLRHFGQAMVPTVFDFGGNGRPPSHPALLDWLAAEFMDQGWSMKAMHRLLVTSASYRMASTSNPADLTLDRDNRYLWHTPSRRMEAEVVRDCIFYVAGKLDLRMGGADIDFHLGLTTPRRSLYFRHAAEKEMEFLKLFDCAAVTECYQRKESIMPQQALALANSELTLQHARQLGRHLALEAGTDPAAFVTAAFEQILSRQPSADEMRACLAYLNEQDGQERTKLSGQRTQIAAMMRARESLVHVLMNHNDFVTIR